MRCHSPVASRMRRIGSVKTSLRMSGMLGPRRGSLWRRRVSSAKLQPRWEPSFARHAYLHAAIPALLLAAALLSGASFLPVSTPAQAIADAAPARALPARATAVPVKVYFSRFPQSLHTFTAVFPVARVAPAPDVATFAIQLLIAGPTLTERRAGYFSELNSLLSGPSACSAPYPTGGPDFTLHLDRKGSKVARGTATLTFCRSLSSPGIGADARVRAEIVATLKQFARIKQVVILTRDGRCFGDESGADRCLR